MKTPPKFPKKTDEETLRCVVLFHQGGFREHWDLMLEVRNTLWTWRLAKLPTINQKILGERIADHRTHYLDYEGPVSNNRGTVNRIRTGSYRWVKESPNYFAVLQFENESWELMFENEKPTAKINITNRSTAPISDES